jgi:hypothetical protein
MTTTKKDNGTIRPSHPKNPRLQWSRNRKLRIQAPDLLQQVRLTFADRMQTLAVKLTRAATPSGRTQESTNVTKRADTVTKKPPSDRPQPADGMGSSRGPSTKLVIRNAPLIPPGSRQIVRTQSQVKANRSLNDNFAGTQVAVGQAHRPNKNTRKDITPPSPGLPRVELTNNDLKSPPGNEESTQTKNTKKKKNKKNAHVSTTADPMLNTDAQGQDNMDNLTTSLRQASTDN